MKRRTLYLLLIAGFLVALIAAGVLWVNSAQTKNPGAAAVTSDDTLRTVSVSGQGQVNAAPDTAVVQLGVQTQADTAQAALDENNQKVQSLLGSLKQNGVAPKDIQTVSIRLRPQYEHSGDTRTLAGYLAANNVLVHIRDLDSLGTILDAAVEAGSNTIDKVQFQISDTAQLQEQARELAIENARDKALELAASTNAQLGTVLTIEEARGAPGPVDQEYTLETEAASVPIERGTQSITVEVSVTWLLQVAE